MASKRIVQYETEINPNGTNDFVVIDSVGGVYRKVSLSEVANTGGLVKSVNGLQGIVELDADDIEDGLLNKFATADEKIKLQILKTDQGSTTFLSGDGQYRTVPIDDATNLGTGTQIFSSIASSQLQFKTLVDGNYIGFSAGLSEITLDDSGIVTFIEERIAEAGTNGNSGIYNGSSPTTQTVGGIAAGTNITGKTFEQLFQDLLTPFQNPNFTSFSISGQATLIEVGTSLSGSKTFTWTTSNSGNVATNSVAVRDVTANVLLASSLANDGSESISIGTITNSSPITQQWRVEATNTQGGSLNSSNFNVNSTYPYFYGKLSGSRPTSNQTLIDSGTKVVGNSGSTISVPYSSTSSEYIWFAIPSTSTSKAIWYVNALNNGSIGGSVDPGGNLFPAFDTVSIDSSTSLWSGVNYKVYVSNYPSEVNTIEFRN